MKSYYLLIFSHTEKDPPAKKMDRIHKIQLRNKRPAPQKSDRILKIQLRNKRPPDFGRKKCSWGGGGFNINWVTKF